MSLQTNPAIIFFRTVARRVGFTRFAGHFIQRAGYEAAFDKALFAVVGPGDVVWDVGANVGHYTRKFAEVVGSNGAVFAFEPFPSTVERLCKNVANFTTVTVHSLALGQKDGTIAMQEGTDSLLATSRIVDGGTFSSEDNTDLAEIEMATGDRIVSRGLARPPTIVKIDTEGFELDVLKGMTEVLTSPITKAVFVEVHFGLLAERGQATAPREIEELLCAAGFTIRWIDASHIGGFRE